MTNTKSNVKIVTDASNIKYEPRFEVMMLRQKLKDIELEFAQERIRRIEAEKKIYEILEDRDKNWVRRISKEERDKLREEHRAAYEQRQLTERKSDGNPIAHAADEFRSYTEMQMFLDELKKTGRFGVRNWAMVRVGICLGLRVSDLIRIRWNWLKKPDGTWRERMPVVEQKTSKLNNILITEAVKETLNEYIDWLGGYDLNDAVFTKSNGKPITKKYGSQIISDMNKVVGLSQHISSHTMRKTFANIVMACYDGTMEMEAVDRVRSLLNHTSLASTNHYLGIVRLRDDAARESVSDFVLGKTDVDVLELPKQATNNDLYDAIEALRNDIAIREED